LSISYEKIAVKFAKPLGEPVSSNFRWEVWIAKVIYSLFPLWQLNFSPWRNLWLEKNLKDLLGSNRIAYVLLMLGYPLHYFIVDIPLHLNVDERWFFYRFGLGALSLVSLLLTFVPQMQRHFHLRFIFALNAALVCFFQARSMEWSREVPYFWGLLFVGLFSISFRLSLIPSVLIASGLLALQIDSNLAAGVSVPLLVGASFTVVLVVALFAVNVKIQIAAFLTNQEYLLAQQKLVETQKEMSEQIQAFLPRVIKSRLLANIQRRRMTVLQAMDEVLRVRHARIAALFSDIRGYTSHSKNTQYLSKSAIPNIKSVIRISEDHLGVTRQIGDLVFAYFDEPTMEDNILHSLEAAREIVLMNENHNAGLESHLKIRRYVLIDIGEAMVGNIGGADSSREITAMGTCVNRLSRMDPMTKEQSLQNLLGFTAVLLSAEASAFAKKVLPGIPIREVALESLKLTMRDFPEERAIGIIAGADLQRFEEMLASNLVIERKAS
jgi:class 3 adenylate cyclase